MCVYFLLVVDGIWECEVLVDFIAKTLTTKRKNPKYDNGKQKCVRNYLLQTKNGVRIIN